MRLFAASALLEWFILASSICLVHFACGSSSSSGLLIASSELTLRTTSSVDIQVCAPGVLSDERVSVADAISAVLRFQLAQTSAVYLVREYTSTSGDVCFLYVYQAPSPEIASYTEMMLAQQSGQEGLLTIQYTSATGASLTLQCATAVAPWRGEDPPLPIFPEVTAADLIMWGAIAGGALAFAVVTACCCVICALSRKHVVSVHAHRHAHHHHPHAPHPHRHPHQTHGDAAKR